MVRRSLQPLCWSPGSLGGDQAQGGGHLSGQGGVEGVGLLQEEAGLHQGEGLGEVEEDPHPQGEGLLLEEGGHLPLEEGAGQVEDRLDHQPDAQGDPLPGHQEAGPVAQPGAGGTRHPAVQIPLVKQCAAPPSWVPLCVVFV